ncbi:MAG: bile acid:sodium symporter [Bacteroidota bacterium]|nr:bile acid:sodium symporter [Bacteroidota bacterium]
MKVMKFLRDWTLPISMLTGLLGYILYVHLPFLDSTHETALHLVGIIQPALIFTMLFLSFCKVNPKELRLQRWHGWLMLVQAGSFALLSLLLIIFPNIPAHVVIEGAMICMICPTATAAVVITDKLGGNATTLTSYTIISNLVAAIVAPLLLPMVHPIAGLTFFKSFCLILSKVFPLLICPFLAACVVRTFFPSLHRKLLLAKDLAFYLWAVALAIAIAVTVRALVHSDVSLMYEIGIGVISLICCLLQFYVGRNIGHQYDDVISAGQGLGQKNTVFAIWMGYTFLTPITAVAGGFYSVWHNTINSYQLYRKRQGK